MRVEALNVGNASRISHPLWNDGKSEFPFEEVVLLAESRCSVVSVYAEDVMIW